MRRRILCLLQTSSSDSRRLDDASSVLRTRTTRRLMSRAPTTRFFMHNCGHDVHASILLASAALIRANAAHFTGKIVFLFQPAEEVAGGADDIVKDSILPQLGVV